MSTNENRAAMLRQMEKEKREVYEALGYRAGGKHIYMYAVKCEEPLGSSAVMVKASSEEDAWYKARVQAKAHPLSTGGCELVMSTRLQTWAVHYCPIRNSGHIFKEFITTYSAKQALVEFVQGAEELTHIIVGVHHVKEV